MRGIKSTLLFARDNAVPAALQQVKMHNAAQLYSEDLFEAMRAMMAKEPPNFTRP